MTLVRSKMRPNPSLSGEHAWLMGVNSVLMRQIARDLFFHGVHLTLSDASVEMAENLRDRLVHDLSASAVRRLSPDVPTPAITPITRIPEVGRITGSPEAVRHEAGSLAGRHGPPDIVVIGPPRAPSHTPLGHPDITGWLASITGVVEAFTDDTWQPAGPRLLLPIPHNPPLACRPALYGFVDDLHTMLRASRVSLQVQWYPGDLSGDARDAADTSERCLAALLKSHPAAGIRASLRRWRRAEASPVGQKDLTNPFRRLLHGGPTSSVTSPVHADLPLIQGEQVTDTATRNGRAASL